MKQVEQAIAYCMLAVGGREPFCGRGGLRGRHGLVLCCAMSEGAKIEGAECAADGEYRTHGFNPVVTDHPCAGCGYNLRGIDRAGICPECSMAVERSFRGDRQRDAGYGALRRIHLGVVIIMAVYAGKILRDLMSLASSFLPFDIPLYYARGLWYEATVGAVLLLGTWLYTVYGWKESEKQGFPPPRSRMRGVLRFIVVVSLLRILVLRSAWIAATGPWQDSPRVAAVLQWYVNNLTLAWIFEATVEYLCLAALMLYTRWLAWRVPAPALARRALRWAWLLPLILLITEWGPLPRIPDATMMRLYAYLLGIVSTGVPIAAFLTLNTMRRYLLAEIITRTDSRGKGGRPLLDLARGGRWIWRTVRAVPSRDMRIEEGNREQNVP